MKIKKEERKGMNCNKEKRIDKEIENFKKQPKEV